MRENVVIRTVTRLTVPFILIFGLYIILHGSSRAGGGFQGGVIVASAFILIGIAFGLDETRRRVREKVRTVASILGISIFIGIGLLCILFGASFLGYAAIPLPLDTPGVRGLMMEAVEIGIGITVMAVMTSIFYDIATKEEGE